MKNKHNAILCLLIATFFLIPLMGNTAMGTEYTVDYAFNSRDTTSEPPKEWTYNPAYMVDLDEDTYATTGTDSDLQLLDGNQCFGLGPGTITKVEIMLKGYYTGTARDITLQPVFSGGEGNNHVIDVFEGPPGQWTALYDITEDQNAPGTWTYNHVANLECKVKAEPDMSGSVLGCSKVTIRVTYTL